MSADGSRLVRVTSAPPQDLFGDWSPDGTRLVLRRKYIGLVVLSLETGDVVPLGVKLSDEAGTSFNYAVGGLK